MTSYELKKGEEKLNLNNKELKLLKLFLLNQNELLDHERIYDYVWDYDEEPSDNSLRTYIKNLRKIIGKERIVSLKKLGYRFIS
jgi:DNA-binding response OmpR family regulator